MHFLNKENDIFWPWLLLSFSFLFFFHEIKKRLVIMFTLDRFGIRVTIDQASDLSFGFFKSSADIEIEKFAKDGVAEYFDD